MGNLYNQHPLIS